MADVDFNWSVQKLHQLQFDGDADALAAYVNALIENNRDAEGGDPGLLRTRARQELEDFLGKDDAVSFVDALMTHLERGKAVDNKSSRGDPESADRGEQRDSNPMASQANRKKSMNSDAQNLTDISRKSESWSGIALSDSRSSTFSRDHRRLPASREHNDDRRSRRDHSSSARGNAPSSQFRESNDSHRRGLALKNDVPPSDDLRHQLSRSRSGASLPSKRPRDADERAPNDVKRREFDKSQPQDRQPGRQLPKDDDRDRRSQMDVAEANHHQRHMNLPNEVNPNGLPGKALNNSNPAAMVSHGAAPLGLLPPPPPEILNHMRHMMSVGHAPPAFPPPPPGLIPSGGMLAPGAIPAIPGTGHLAPAQGRRVQNRGGMAGHNRQPHHGAGSSRGRTLNSVLVMRNVPSEKLTLGVINEFFEKFGTISNIQLRPAHEPDHAYIEFSNRAEAQAAYDSVDAVMGNRHVRLYWARESDFEQDGISLAGVERAPPVNAQKATTRARPQQQTRSPQTSAVPVEEDPEALLQRKRKEIAAAREEQERVKAERQAEYDSCIREQKELFGKLESGCSADEKKEVLKRIKTLRNTAESILTSIKGKDVSSKASSCGPDAKQQAGSNNFGHGRFRGPMSADFRPRVAYIRGASNPGLNETSTTNIFHDTANAKLVDGEWILEFGSRRAAESALKAVRLLKQWFGPNATMFLPENRTSEPALGTVQAVTSEAGTGSGEAKIDGDAQEDGSERPAVSEQNSSIGGISADEARSSTPSVNTASSS